MILVKPTVGRVTSPFGFRPHPIEDRMDFHPGLDFAHVTQQNDKVVAVADGVVKRAAIGAKGYGNFIVIEHDGFCSLYAHLKTVDVVKFQSIKQGALIGIKGTSGSSNGVHLHFEIRLGSYKDFWAKFSNDEWKHVVDPEKFYLKNSKRESSDLDLTDVADYFQEAWVESYMLEVNDGEGANNNITEAQLMQFFKNLGLFDFLKASKKSGQIKF